MPDPFGQSNGLFRQLRRRVRARDPEGHFQLDRRVCQRHRESQICRSGSAYLSSNDRYEMTIEKTISVGNYYTLGRFLATNACEPAY